MQDCTRCGHRKPLEAFAVDRSSKAGYRPSCKVCNNTSRAAARKANPEETHAKDAAYRAASLHQRRKYDREWKRRQRAQDPEGSKARRRAYYAASPAVLAACRAWRAANPGRMAALMAAWREANPERNRATSRLSTNKRRARKVAASIVPFTQGQLAARIAYWGGQCYVCGDPWQEIDHVKPLSRGGPHCLANLRPICEPCNLRKSNRWGGPRWSHGLTRERITLAG